MCTGMYLGGLCRADAFCCVCAGGDASSQLAALLAADPSLKDRLPLGALAALGPMGERKPIA